MYVFTGNVIYIRKIPIVNVYLTSIYPDSIIINYEESMYKIID